MLTGIRNFAVLLPHVALQAWKKFGADNCSQIAAGLSYYVLFGLVPLSVLAFGVLSFLGAESVQERVIARVGRYVSLDETNVYISIDGSTRDDLEEALGTNAVAAIDQELEAINDPAAGAERRAELVPRIDDGEPVVIAGYTLEADQLDVELEGILPDAIRTYGDSRGPFPLIGFVLVVFSASIIFSSYSRALNHIWKARTLRPLVQQKLIDIAALVVAGTLFLVSVVASGVIGALGRAIRESTDGGIAVSGGLVWVALLFVVPLLVSFTFCACAYMFLPQRKNALHDVWLGAIVGAVGLESLKFGFSLYVSFFSSYDETYGAFGVVLLGLTFVYLSSYLLLLGAEVGYVYPLVRDGALVPEASPSRTVRGTGPLRTLIKGVSGLFVERKDE